MAINEAYHTLSDTTKRSVYHRQWLEYFSPRHQYVQSMEQFRTRRGDNGFYSATDVMDDFFHALKTRNWDSAYLKMTEEDRECVTAQRSAVGRQDPLNGLLSRKGFMEEAASAEESNIWVNGYA